MLVRALLLGLLADGFAVPEGLARRPRSLRARARPRRAAAPAELARGGGATKPPPDVSKRAMLGFAGPALGIFLAGPLMSNIDNVFVGRFAGTEALAALSPGTVVADQLLYLFSFLGRATTGLAARAYARGGTDAAREALAAPLTLALAIGLALTAVFAFGTPSLLAALGVAPHLRPTAAVYARVRGLVAWAALAQNVALSALLATRDAATPLKVALLAAGCNLVGDFALCCWPLRLGAAGAAAATSLSVLAGAALMTRALARRGMLPRLRPRALVDPAAMGPLLAFAGPLSVIVLTRLAGLTAQALTAASLGTAPLAAYQVCVNIFAFFIYFAEPLSQTGQTLLPPLIDAGDGARARKAVANLAVLAAAVAPLVAGACALLAGCGASLFSADAAVVALVRRTAFPALFLTTAQLVVSSSIDGLQLAARDFGFIVVCGTCTCAAQLAGLRAVGRAAAAGAAWPARWGLSLVFASFWLRLLTYAIISSGRIALGYGALGRVLRGPGRRAADAEAPRSRSTVAT